MYKRQGHERTLACRRAAERYKPEADQVLKEEISDNNTHIVFEICKDGLNDEDGRIKIMKNTNDLERKLLEVLIAAA